MHRRLLLLSLVVSTTFGACAVLPPIRHPSPPQQTTVILPFAPDLAYQKAYTTFARQPGWVITGAVKELRTFHGIVHNAAHIAVLVEAQPPGARVTIQGSILPNKLVIGQFTEVQDFAMLLQGTR